MTEFLNDVITGLLAQPKFLQSKYFYDDIGDTLFQQIMHCPEYYLTRCEAEIFSTQAGTIAETLLTVANDLDIVELGAGDASKSILLLKEIAARTKTLTYYPIDISANIIADLNQKIPADVAGVKVHGLNGEYLPMLKKLTSISSKRKVVLFLGSNIGNVNREHAASFCQQVRSHLSPGDMMLIGFDLQKDPAVILNAYNDRAGLTRDFNLNLLHRINKVLNANFDVQQFTHFPIYDPATGACKSYLVSMQDQHVKIADRTIHFHKHEPIFMEVSQKYTVPQIEQLAIDSDFQPVESFFDSKKWFADVVWRCS
jgi:L-histidine Nalpha-methyltransferase